MDKERKSPHQTENIGRTFSVSYLAKAEAINAQFQLGQKLGLTSEKEKEIFNLYLAERLLGNEVRLVIADLNTQIKNENPENTSTSFQPTEEMLALWRDKWVPQLVSNTPYPCQNIV